MTTVIATGCPHSDWEKVLPILQLSGLESAGDTFASWYDELFQPFSIMDPPQVEYQLQQEPKNGRSVAKLLPEKSTAPLLLAESRSLWLLDFWAAKLPHAQFLLFYTRAESAVAHAFVQGIDPHQFLEGWQVANRQLLRFQRCHRQQALLFDAETAVRHPRELIEACRRFDLPLQTPPELPSSNRPVATVEYLLAKYLVAERPEVQTLQTELEATAQPLGDNIPAEQFQPVELVCSYLQHKMHERNLRHSLSEAREQLQRAENEQKEQILRTEELTNMLANQIDLASSYRTQHEEVQRQLQERDVAIANLQEDLNNRQDEIGRLQWYLGERDADIIRLKEALTAQDSELSRIHNELHNQYESLERQQQEHLSDIESLKTSLAKKNEENDSLARSLSEQDASMRRMELSLEMRDEEMSVLTNERQSQMDEKFKFAADLQAQLEQLTLFKAEKERQTSGLQARIAFLTDELENQTKLSYQRQAKIDQLTRSQDKQAKFATDLQTKLLKAQQEKVKLEADNKALEINIEICNVKIKDRFLELAALTKMLEEREDQLMKNRIELSEHERYSAAQDKEIEALRMRLTKFKKSASWKMTVPVRAFGRFLKMSSTNAILVKNQVKTIKKSDLFDETWYLNQNPDVAKSGNDPAEHYLRYGDREGRNPGPHFDSSWYLKTNPDVSEAGMNPLVHFIRFGKLEGRTAKQMV